MFLFEGIKKILEKQSKEFNQKTSKNYDQSSLKKEPEEAKTEKFEKNKSSKFISEQNNIKKEFVVYSGFVNFIEDYNIVSVKNKDKINKIAIDLSFLKNAGLDLSDTFLQKKIKNHLFQTVAKKLIFLDKTTDYIDFEGKNLPIYKVFLNKEKTIEIFHNFSLNLNSKIKP